MRNARLRVQAGPSLHGVLWLALGMAIPAAEVLAQAEAGAIEEVVVTASRLPSTASFSGSLTLIDEADLRRQRALNKDMMSLLSFEVPGFSTSPGSVSSFDTTLRGRSAVVLVDGVPISPTLRQAGRDIMSIDFSAIGSIEVVRGASAIYGNGGAGGVVNYITRQPTQEGVNFSSELSLGASLTDPSDSLRPAFLQTASGKIGDIDFVATASYEEINSFVDSDGDRIPPSQTGNGGLPDSDIINLFGKMGTSRGQHRFEASTLYYEQAQRTGFFAVAGDVPTRRKATAEAGILDPRATDEGNENLVINTVYSYGDVLGSTLRMQAYYQEVSQTFDFRPDRFGGSQSVIQSEKVGGRLDINTPLSFAGVSGGLLWGIDFTNDQTVQNLTDGRIFVPFLDQDAFAQFAQLELSPTPWLDVQAGLRHESFDVTVKPFTSLTSGVDVEGGQLDYQTTVWNVGPVVHIGSFDVFAAFSQGFSLSDIGREIRDSQEPDFLQSLKPKPVVFDNYEIGMRYHADRLSGELSVFLSESDLGARFEDDPNNPGLLIQRRDPERTHGVEAALRAVLSDTLRAGGTFTWIEGKADTDDDGGFETYLNGRRIPPVKITAFVERDLRADWLVRLQALYSGSRDKFDDATSGTGLGRVDSFITFDLMTSLELGPGSLSVGVQNILNEDYFPVSAQVQNRPLVLVEAPGATAVLRYSMAY